MEVVASTLAPNVAGIRFQTKSDSVASWLRDEILGGRLVPETPLLQEDIAERLGVSSTPVREAFGMLEAEGFVERRPHRGVFVARRDPEDVADAFRVRMLLEAHAARTVAETPNLDVISSIEGCLARAAAAMKARDPEQFRAANNAFHMAIVDGARSRTLSKIMTYILPRSRLYVPPDPNWMPRRQAEHEQILRALRARDGEKASVLLHEHNRLQIDRTLPRAPSGEASRVVTISEDFGNGTKRGRRAK